MKWWWLTPIPIPLPGPAENKAQMILGGCTLGLFLFLVYILDKGFLEQLYGISIKRNACELLVSILLARPIATLVAPKAIKEGDAAAELRIRESNRKGSADFFKPTTSVEKIARTKLPSQIDKMIIFYLALICLFGGVAYGVMHEKNMLVLGVQGRIYQAVWLFITMSGIVLVFREIWRLLIARRKSVEIHK